VTSVGSAIGGVLPEAVGVALSPLPVSAAILLLLGPTPVRRTLGMIVGWVAGIVVVICIATIALAGTATDDSGATSSGIGWGKVALGAGLVVLAGRSWRKRPSDGGEPVLPRWMSAIDSLGPARAAGAGLVLAALNPKNLLLGVAAGTSVAAADLGAGEDVVVIVVYTVIAASTIVLPVVVYLLARESAASRLESARAWLVDHNAVVVSVVLVLMGAKVLGDGLGIL
jgi:threonine/homoserine/homoserine lactone efflux protein